jgi:hypothetical protein
VATADGGQAWAELADAPAWIRQGEWPRASLLVCCCGTFEVYADGVRLTRELTERPTVLFLWLYLLLRSLVQRGQPMRREEFAEEMSPGVDRKSQWQRLRNRLFDMKPLPAVLSESIQASRGRVRFDPVRAARGGAFAVDVGLLHDLADDGRRDGRYGDEAVPAVERLLELCRAEVLPEWEGLEERMTGGRGGGMELIGLVRTRHREDLAAVLVALGQTHLESGWADRAVELFQLGLDVRPDREDVARRLTAALIASGRGVEAERVRKEYLE